MTKIFKLLHKTQRTSIQGKKWKIITQFIA